MSRLSTEVQEARFKNSSEHVAMSKKVFFEIIDAALKKNPEISLEECESQPLIKTQYNSFAVGRIGGRYVSGVNDDGQRCTAEINELAVLNSIIPLLYYPENWLVYAKEAVRSNAGRKGSRPNPTCLMQPCMNARMAFTPRWICDYFE